MMRAERWNARPRLPGETTPPLQPRFPRVCRQRERVVGFEEAPNKEGSRPGRNAEGLRTKYGGISSSGVAGEGDSGAGEVGSILTWEDLKAKVQRSPR
ncbi:hypothetical protein Tco_0776166 [Tanacetum coccineum]